MQSQRQPYVKPVLVRLDYPVDARVSMAGQCKSGSQGGSGLPDICDTPPTCSESS